MFKLNQPLIKNIIALLDYMWHDEQKHYIENDCEQNHIYENLREIRNSFGLQAKYPDVPNI